MEVSTRRAAGRCREGDAHTLATGPEDAWKDQWSTRWNPNVFVNQDYVVVMINPTGSSTFGQGTRESLSAYSSLWAATDHDARIFADFASGIKNDWGGKSFVDLKNGWNYILKKYPEVRCR